VSRLAAGSARPRLRRRRPTRLRPDRPPTLRPNRPADAPTTADIPADPTPAAAAGPMRSNAARRDPGRPGALGLSARPPTTPTKLDRDLLPCFDRIGVSGLRRTPDLGLAGRGGVFCRMINVDESGRFWISPVTTSSANSARGRGLQAADSEGGPVALQAVPAPPLVPSRRRAAPRRPLPGPWPGPRRTSTSMSKLAIVTSSHRAETFLPGRRSRKRAAVCPAGRPRSSRVRRCASSGDEDDDNIDSEYEGTVVKVFRETASRCSSGERLFGH